MSGGDSRRGTGVPGVQRSSVPPGSIAAKRRGARIQSIQKKVDEGRVEGHERGLVRLGTMNTKILTGQEDLSVWSDEELVRGQRRDKNGRWQGRRPVVVAKAVHDELVRRTLDRASETMRDNLQAAVEALVGIVTGQDVEDKDKLKAIQMIMDRVMGKEPQKIEFPQEQPWMVAITAGIIGTEEQYDEDSEPEEEEDDLDG